MNGPWNGSGKDVDTYVMKLYVLYFLFELQHKIKIIITKVFSVSVPSVNSSPLNSD